MGGIILASNSSMQPIQGNRSRHVSSHYPALAEAKEWLRSHEDTVPMLQQGASHSDSDGPVAMQA